MIKELPVLDIKELGFWLKVSTTVVYANVLSAAEHTKC